MTRGIYGYWDKIKKYVPYIGQSKDIERRLKEHRMSSRYNEQPINQALQNNPYRYESFILVKGDFTPDELNEMEYQAIEIFKTNRYKYPENEGLNFKDGGDVQELPEETRKKISKSMKGREPWNKGKTDCYSDETLQKLSESSSCENNPRWKSYARIIKRGFKKNKQMYGIKFNGKVIKSSFFIDKLEKWFKDNYPEEELVIDESIKS